MITPLQFIVQDYLQSFGRQTEGYITRAGRSLPECVCPREQGDPLSSYLFILCMEVLLKNLTKLQSSKELQGLKIARSAPKISHLFFVDEALFFVKATPNNC